MTITADYDDNISRKPGVVAITITGHTDDDTVAMRVSGGHDDTCAECGAHTMSRSRNGFCDSCAPEHEPDWEDS